MDVTNAYLVNPLGTGPLCSRSASIFSSEDVDFYIVAHGAPRCQVGLSVVTTCSAVRCAGRQGSLLKDLWRNISVAILSNLRIYMGSQNQILIVTTRVRERAKIVWKPAEVENLTHFDLHKNRLVANFVTSIITVQVSIPMTGIKRLTNFKVWFRLRQVVGSTSR